MKEFSISYDNEYQENEHLNIIRKICNAFTFNSPDLEEFFNKELLNECLEFLEEKILYLHNIENSIKETTPTNFYDFVFVANALDKITMEDKHCNLENSLINISTLLLNEMMNYRFIINIMLLNLSKDYKKLNK